MLGAAVPAALGVVLPASAQTVIGNRSATYTLNAANNPFVIDNGTTIAVPAGPPATPAAILGDTLGAQWTLTNNGTVVNASHYAGTAAIYLDQRSTVTNGATGVITGDRAIAIFAGPSAVKNLGNITGIGEGIYIAGGAGTVTNAGRDHRRGRRPRRRRQRDEPSRRQHHRQCQRRRH